MRKYTLASGDARMKVDLRDYADTIEKAVHEYMPIATVKICESCYYVTPAPSKGEAIKIGRKICQSALAQHCVMIPKLFTSVEITDNTKEEPKDGTDQSKFNGGHF